eukprot:CAMPEP_0198586440 /NCGR_PEP_ID=MMETSP1462-20131121/130635_1 /TAXON_ID=1333877 /ORGANISM="Brandtodinium nutriculum, Strain RCC3387" /LENGTH=62 /DNA_ID=CAMNT_0044317897 /DNA_START=71 /DNA_END=255 /DNA_ORIENTATION=+
MQLDNTHNSRLSDSSGDEIHEQTDAPNAPAPAWTFSLVIDAACSSWTIMAQPYPRSRGLNAT